MKKNVSKERWSHNNEYISIEIYACINRICYARVYVLCTFWCWLKAQHKNDAIKMQNLQRKKNSQQTQYSIMKCEHTSLKSLLLDARTSFPSFCILKFQSKTTWNTIQLHPIVTSNSIETVFIDSMRLFAMKQCEMMKTIQACFSINKCWNKATHGNASNELQRYLFAHTQPLQKKTDWS